MPKDSILHRTPLWFKGIICASILIVLAVTGWKVGVGTLAFCLILSWISGMRTRTLWSVVYALRWVFIILGLYYVFWGTWQNALDVFCTMLCAVLISRVLLTTTPLPRVLDGIVWLLTPLNFLGIPSERLGLLLALMLRSIPAILDKWGALQCAAQARGLSRRTAWRLLVPLVIQTVDYAQKTGDALLARGLHPEK